MRTKILKITSLIITYIIFVMTILTIRHEQIKIHEYTYIIGNSMGISNNCYVNDYDFRICELKDKLIKVDMFYEEEDYE